MDTTALSRTELLQVADAVAREKSIEREEVLDAMEQAVDRFEAGLAIVVVAILLDRVCKQRQPRDGAER